MLGPLTDRKQFGGVMAYLDSGMKESGAGLLTGGGRVGEKGCYIQPTIFLNPRADSRISREEIFGPVLNFRTFDIEDEAVELANDTSYGFSACVFNASISRALRVAGRLQTGTVAINAAFFPDVQTPFSSYKLSGIGGRTLTLV